MEERGVWNGSRLYTEFVKLKPPYCITVVSGLHIAIGSKGETEITNFGMKTLPLLHSIHHSKSILDPIDLRMRARAIRLS
jgi:hypothetical protein